MKKHGYYLFTYFAGEKYADGENIFFAVSRDGLHWQDINDNHPILTSNSGTHGIRDPFIIKNPRTNQYTIIGTDLKMHEADNWGEVQRTGSRSLLISNSDDLLNWSAPQLIEVAPEGFGCVWAPEATYDPVINQFLVYWSSKTNEDDYKKQRVYCATTPDFTNFSSPKLMIEKDHSTIDTTVIHYRDHYYRFSKDETDKRVFAERLKQLASTPQPVTSPALTALSGVEGPTIYKLVGQSKWVLLLDNYSKSGYFPLLSNNLPKGEFKQLPESAYHMPSRARHGTVISIAQEEYQRIKNHQF